MSFDWMAASGRDALSIRQMWNAPTSCVYAKVPPAASVGSISLASPKVSWLRIAGDLEGPGIQREFP